MKLSIDKVSSLVPLVIILIFLSLLVGEQLNIHNTWLKVKPQSNASTISNLLTREKMKLEDKGEDINVRITSNDIPPIIPADSESNMELFSGTKYYVEGTYSDFCVISFNDTEKEKNVRMVIRDSSYFPNEYSIGSKNCPEGIIERAIEDGVKVNSYGGRLMA